MGGSRGGWGGGTGGPQNTVFSSNIDPDPLKFTKLLSQHSMVGHYLHASETPFQWRFAGWADDGPLLVAVHSLYPIKKKKPDPVQQNFLDPHMHKTLLINKNLEHFFQVFLCFIFGFIFSNELIKFQKNSYRFFKYYR